MQSIISASNRHTGINPRAVKPILNSSRLALAWPGRRDVQSFILVALLIACAATARAATVSEVWRQRYSGTASNATDHAVKVVRDAAGDIIVTGHTASNPGDTSDFLTAKYSGATGTLLWQRRYDGPAHRDDQPTGLAVDASGDVLVTGCSTTANGTSDYYTAKYAAEDGALVWERRYNGPANSYDKPSAVAVTSSGDVVVTGFSYGTGANGDFYTAKYAAADGMLLWERRYDDAQATALAVDANDDVVMTGVAYDGIAPAQFYTAKYAGPDGALLWESHSLGSEGVNRPNAMALDGFGNVVVAGSVYGTNFGAEDFYTVKYDAFDGSLVWEQTYDGPGNASDEATAVAVDASGDVLVTGYSTPNILNTNAEYYTVKYAAATGALLWERRYSGPLGGESRAVAIAVDGNGNAVVTGSSGQVNDTRVTDIYTAMYGGADGSLLWGRRYNGPQGNDDQAVGLAIHADGTVVVAGTSANSIGDDDYYIGRYAAANGALLGERRYSGPGGGASALRAVAVDLVGNVAVTGESFNSTSGFDCYTAKYAAGSGSLLWERRYNGPGNQDDSATAVAMDAAGNVVLSGYSKNAGSGNPFYPPNDDYYTAKYAAADGALLWEQRYNGPLIYGADRAIAVAVDASGNVVVTGRSEGGEVSDGRFYTAKYGVSNGALLWERRGPSGTDQAKGIVVDGNGNIVVTGVAYTNFVAAYYTAKYSGANGAILWEQWRTVGQPSAMALDVNGNVVVTGTGTTNGNSPPYVHTIKYASVSGALLWEKRFVGAGSSLAVDAGGNVVVAASVSGYCSDFLTVKYAAVDGSVVWEQRHSSPFIDFASPGCDWPSAVAVDVSGNVIVTGPEGHSLADHGPYTAKYRAADGALLWGTRVEGRNCNVQFNEPVPWRLALAPDGSIIVAGNSCVDFATMKYVEDTNTPSVVVNEVLTRTTPGGGFIELFNPTTTAGNLGGWFLADSATGTNRFRIPSGTMIDPMSYIVFTEAQFSAAPGAGDRFGLNPRGGGVHLLSADEGGSLTGYSSGFTYGPAGEGESFGRHVLSTGEEQFPAQRSTTPGAANSGPRIGPVVINEIYYNPPPGSDEFIELKNVGATNVALFNSTDGWRLHGYAFPAGTELGAGDTLLLVGINPATFRNRYGVPASVPVFGPFPVALSNGLNQLVLARPEVLDTNDLAYITVDAVRYDNRPPWPSSANGHGPSLQRSNTVAYGNDPVTWVTAAATPGTDYPGGGLAPAILAHPPSQVVFAGQTVALGVSADGAPPLSYQWAFNGVVLSGATSSNLILNSVLFTQAGSYHVTIFNGAGSAISTSAVLTVAGILSQPTNQTVHPGSNAVFTVVAAGSSALRFQWSKDEVDIAGATNATLMVMNAQLTDQGTYRCVLTDIPGALASAPAQLNLVFAPTIVQQPQSQTNIAGDNVTFTVTVTNNATLPVSFRWRKQSLTLTNMLLNSRTSSFTLFNVDTNITRTNGPGNYSVVVSNAASAGAGFLSTIVALVVLPASAPAATTLSAGDLGPNAATLHASVNPMGAQTVAWFDYGLTAAYGSRTSATNVGNAAGSISFAQSVGGLLPGTNYHYRVVATNHGGMALGADLVFQTAASVAPPTISAYELLGTGQFRLRFDSSPGTSFSVLVSSNLADWNPLGPAGELTPGHFEFTDTDAPSQPTRFYRLRTP